jgi:tRNA(fMet)-specific endonuclease VapC
MYLLDTDHVAVLQTQAAGDFKRLTDRMKRRPASDFFVAIVTFHEQMLGWNAYISRAKNLTGVVRGYNQLQGLLEYFRDAQVLPFDHAAADQFQALRKRARIATMDLRIAAIGMSRDMTVLTRNLADFQRVPDLRVEDWTAK